MERRRLTVRALGAALLLSVILLVSGLVFNLVQQGPGFEQPASDPALSFDDQDLAALLGVVPLFPMALGLLALIVLLGEPSGSHGRRSGRRFRLRRPRVSAAILALLILILAIPVAFSFIDFARMEMGFPGVGRTPRPPGETPTDGDAASLAGDALRLVSRFPGLLGGVLGFAFDLGEIALVVPVPALPLILTIVAMAGFSAGLVLLRRRRRPAQGMRWHPESASIEPAAEGLSFGRDVRSSILRCFHDFCTNLERVGFDAREPLTPREIEDIAVSEFGVAPEAARGLTALFEEARYSAHPLDEDDRSQAEDSLDRIRAGVRPPPDRARWKVRLRARDGWRPPGAGALRSPFG